jgi:peptidoglycan/xylan/chitin deacetylase (PgdA/CDA1 family)
MITETPTSPAMLQDLVKRALYGSGLLGLYHRLRNRRTLTVIMFHRVLSPADPRWASCDPDYTLDHGLFAACIGFFGRHYHVVDAARVLEARRGGRPLPPRALLITFDDGWRDNVDYALPALRAAGLPGLMFAVADAVGAQQPFFQERIVAAWRRGVLDTAALAQAIAAAGHPVPAASDNDIATLRRSIAALEAVPVAARAPILAALEGVLDDGLGHMVDTEGLATLRAGGVAIGLHGKTHEPLTRAPDLDAELSGARAAMARHLGEAEGPRTMSFPHGRFDAAIADRARAAGYELLFTSVPTLNRADRPGWLLGRLGFETAAVADPGGTFRPDRLALYLFRRPIDAPA